MHCINDLYIDGSILAYHIQSVNIIQLLCSMYKKVTMLFSLCSPGVGGVPYFEIYLADKPDLRQQFSGAQPIDTFVAIFNRLSLMAKM